jgi:hypothetical protein
VCMLCVHVSVCEDLGYQGSDLLLSSSFLVSLA